MRVKKIFKDYEIKKYQRNLSLSFVILFVRSLLEDNQSSP